MNKKSYGANIGFSSILITIILLSLVSFAALSQVSANADYRLSQKLADRTTAYYEACNKGQLWLCDLDQTLLEIYQSTSSREAYFTVIANKELSNTISFPISDTQSLTIELEFEYPTGSSTAQDSNSFFKIKKWQTLTTLSLELDETLPLIQNDIFTNP